MKVFARSTGLGGRRVWIVDVNGVCTRLRSFAKGLVCKLDSAALVYSIRARSYVLDFGI
jgi:hypothetical protein